MNKFFSTWIPAALFLTGLHPFSAEGAAGTEVRHAVKVLHPGINPTNSMERTLVQVRYADARSDEFYLEMDSVSCGDAKCEIVTVRMVWDELGFYNRLERAADVNLEKADGNPFQEADYRKLDRILSDRETTIWNVSQKELVEYREADGEVDGVTAATTLPDKNSYVEGAVWTCYTLWHWANGNIYAFIRDITGRAASADELQACLLDDDPAYRLFALEQLIARKQYDPATVEAVVQSASTDHYDFLWLLIEYAEQAETEVYYSLLTRFFESGNPKLRLICLDALLTTQHPPPEGCYEQWAGQLAGSASYMELNRFINLVEKKGYGSPGVLEHMIPLLESDSFIVARRAYWFLSEQELSPAGREKLDAFSEKYADRL